MPNAVIVDAVRSPMGRGKAGRRAVVRAPRRPARRRLRGPARPHRRRPGDVDDVLVGCVSQAASSRRPRAAGRGSRPGSRARAVGDDRPQVRLGPAGRRLRGAGHHRRRLRHRGGRRRRVDEPGADGLGADGRRPVRPRRRALRSRASCRRASPPSWSPHKWGLTRAQLDAYAARSHERAAAAAAGGVRRRDRARSGLGRQSSSADETIRPGHDRRRGSPACAPAFAPSDATPRASPRSTGRSPPATPRRSPTAARALLLMSEETATALGLRPRARILAFAVVGDDPIAHADRPDPGHRTRCWRAPGCAIERHRRGRGQRGVRVGAAGLAGGVRRDPTTGSTRAAARSRSATRSAPPAPA